VIALYIDILEDYSQKHLMILFLLHIFEMQIAE